MAVTANQIQMARKAGYSDDEIVSHLATSEPQMKQAVDAGYKPTEIMAHFDQQKGVVIQGNPDASQSETARMRNEFIKKESGSNIDRLKADFANQSIGEYAKEPLRFATETALMPLNALGRGLKSVASTVQGGGEAIRTGSLDAGLQKYTQKQAEFQPIQSPMKPSGMGEMIGAGFNAGINKLSDLTGRPDIVEPVAMGVADIGALVGLKAAMPAIKAAPKALSTITEPVTNTVKAATNVLKEQSRQKFEANKLDSVIDQAYTQAVRPTVAGKKNSTQINNSVGIQRDAVKTIVENKDILGLDTVNGLPSNLMEFSQAIKAAKDKVFKDYDSMKSVTGEAGVTIDLTPVAAELKALANNKVLLDQKPQVVEYLNKRAEVLNKRGVYTTQEMQDAVKIYNADLKAFYKNPSPQFAAQAAIDARIVDAMRKSLDDAITNEAGPGYQGLKKQYGSLTSVEAEVAQRAIVDARKNPQGLLDFTDIATSGEALAGLLTGNPMMIVRGVAGRGIKEWIKNRNSPNKMVEKMFNQVDKYYTPRQAVDIPSPRANYPKQPMVADPSTGRQIPAQNMPQPRSPANLPVGSQGPMNIRQPLNLPIGQPAAMGSPRTPLNLPVGNRLSDMQPPTRQPLNLAVGRPLSDLKRTPINLPSNQLTSLAGEKPPMTQFEAMKKVIKTDVKRKLSDERGLVGRDINAANIGTAKRRADGVYHVTDQQRQWLTDMNIPVEVNPQYMVRKGANPTTAEVNGVRVGNIAPKDLPANFYQISPDTIRKAMRKEDIQYGDKRSGYTHSRKDLYDQNERSTIFKMFPELY